MDQNNQGRRPHYHRGRRGPDRRGQERRQHQPAAADGSREQARDGGDVEQIMREIRGRISQRHGIDLSPQQIEELAARRLEAILDPRSVKPALLEQMRRGTASLPEDPAPAPAYAFEDNTIYETHRGLLRAIRRLLNPILKLFFNPNPIAQAFNTQAKLNVDAATRESERDRRQAEWNALHYDILQRLVTENSRLSLELQAMSLRVESLGAKVDFNERRVRGLEVPGTGARHQPPAPPRPTQPTAPDSATATQPAQAVPQAEAAGVSPTGETTGDGGRRRRRRRRGRRSGSTLTGTTAVGGEAVVDSDEGEGADGDETGDEAGAFSALGEAGEAGALPVADRPLDAPVAVEASFATEPHPPFPPAPPPENEPAATPVDTSDTNVQASSRVEQPSISAPPDDPGTTSAPPVDPGPPDR